MATYLKSIKQLNTTTIYNIPSGMGGIFRLKFIRYVENNKTYYFENVSPDWEKFNFHLQEHQVLRDISF